MANRQTNSTEYVAKPVAKAAGVPIQTIATAGTTRAEYAGPKVSGPIMKQSAFELS